jgi:hypothetical protein
MQQRPATFVSGVLWANCVRAIAVVRRRMARLKQAKVIDTWEAGEKLMKLQHES